MNTRLVSLVLLVLPAVAQASDWSAEVPVRSGRQTAMRVRARVAGDYLVVQAIHEPGWHCYAMDNELRANEKLAGRPSLGIELGVRIELTSGAELEGPWFQSPPHDLSKPDEQWYTWGFDQTATFARRLARKGSEPITLEVAGQVCNAQTCRPIEVTLTLSAPAVGDDENDFDTKELVEVREDRKEAGQTNDTPSPQESR